MTILLCPLSGGLLCLARLARVTGFILFCSVFLLLLAEVVHPHLAFSFLAALEANEVLSKPYVTWKGELSRNGVCKVGASPITIRHISDDWSINCRALDGGELQLDILQLLQVF